MKKRLSVFAVIALSVFFCFPAKSERISDFDLWQFKQLTSTKPSMDIIQTTQYGNDIVIMHYQYTYEPMSYLQAVEDMTDGEYYYNFFYFTPTYDGDIEFGSKFGGTEKLDANDTALQYIIADLPIQAIKMFALFIDNDMEVEQLEDEKVDEILCSVFRINADPAIIKEQLQDESDGELAIISPEVFAYYYFDANNGDAIRQTMEFEYIEDLDKSDTVTQISIDIRILAIGDEVAVVEPPLGRDVGDVT